MIFWQAVCRQSLKTKSLKVIYQEKSGFTCNIEQFFVMDFGWNKCNRKEMWQKNEKYINKFEIQLDISPPTLFNDQENLFQNNFVNQQSYFGLCKKRCQLFFCKKGQNQNTLILVHLFTKEHLIKVSKSQKQFLLKLHCPNNERNIRQNSALWS